MAKTSKRNFLIAFDVFSGAGGMTQGLKKAGFIVLGAIENDGLAVKTYLRNHPKVKVWEQDIRKVTGAEILNTLGIERGELDLLAGCPPCQGFSTMRTKNGRKKPKDFRNDLIFDYLRLIRTLKPKTVMLENVPALAKNFRMTRFKKALRDLGYDLNNTPEILNTAHFGVPQRRRRMILLASRVGKIKMPKPEKEIVSVRQAIGKLAEPSKSKDPIHKLGEKRDPWTIELIKNIPANGGSRTDLPKRFQLECHKRYPEGFKDVYGRMSWDDVSPTITGGCVSPSKGRFLHPTQNRAITLREAAILQSFPQYYYFSLDRGKTGVALMIGNALPPRFIQKHAIAVRETIVKYNSVDAKG
jgi:DNA (cytosine-5)-methyltransferase 1